ncbi:MAG: hypothetical protein RMK89_14420, partial [Armatimonadota bacterium]|nr:hypothetical protein [Armatimonadota bacterium]MDW8144640.1 hypothetical protein [Armatimonadota bacterium]
AVSIPLWCDCDNNFTVIIQFCPQWFQSHCGAIATARCYISILPPFFVSIPLWCDCDRVFDIDEANIVIGFNPTVVRLRLPFLF